MLQKAYFEVTGEDSLGLVHEISGSVCGLDASSAEILANLGRDISMSADELEQFITRVREVCP